MEVRELALNAVDSDGWYIVIQVHSFYGSPDEEEGKWESPVTGLRHVKATRPHHFLPAIVKGTDETMVVYWHILSIARVWNMATDQRIHDST